MHGGSTCRSSTPVFGSITVILMNNGVPKYRPTETRTQTEETAPAQQRYLTRCKLSKCLCGARALLVL